MTDKKVLSKGERTRRSRIHKEIKFGILENNRANDTTYSPKALKELVSIPVSLKVLNEILNASSDFENIDNITGTTKLTGFKADVSFKFEYEGSIIPKRLVIGEKEAEISENEETLKGVYMDNDLQLEILVEVERLFGNWTLTITDITQYITEDLTQKRKLLDPKKHLEKHSVQTSDDTLFTHIFETDTE